MSEDAKFKLGDVEVSLMELAGLDTSQIEEYRGFTMPVMAGTFKVTAGGLDTLSIDDKKNPGHKKTVAVFKIETEVVDVDVCLDTSIQNDELIGKKFTETFFIQDPIKDIGAIVAFGNDAGFQPAKLGDLITVNTGHLFKGKIKHTVNKNDPDRPYINFSRKNGDIRPAA